ncbi:hypothetical protein ACFQZ8_04870 [Micromonospora azadirachtae]|uniref:Peptidase inhibitor family I36 n=1 Tax=Micromonospora azadirachtae TaxID=1970735 RepID=A0ABW2ZX62_9ACTN
MRTPNMIRLLGRTAPRAAAVAGLSLACVAVSPMPAMALDQGANTAACTTTEICFSEYSSDWNRSHKDFWYDANHHSNNAHVAYAFNAGTNFTRHDVMDHAAGIWNRDSECSVYVWDVNAQGTWYVISAYGNYASGWTSLSPVANRNNGHSRCSSTANPVNK